MTGIASLAPAVRAGTATQQARATVAGAIIEAVVLGRGADGATILRTPAGMLALAGLPDLAIGSLVVLQSDPRGYHLLSTRPPKAATAEAAGPAIGQTADDVRATGPLPGAGLAHRWPAVEAALQALARGGASGAEIAAALPRPGPGLAAALGAFVLGLGHEDGPALAVAIAAALRQSGRGDLARQIEQDAATLGRLARDDGDWRLALVPFATAPWLQQVRLYFRRRGKGNAEADTRRFVIEIDASRFGRIQLDGLAKPRRVDLIMRTESEVPGDERADLARLYIGALGAAGHAGEIHFETRADLPALSPDGGAADHLGLVV